MEVRGDECEARPKRARCLEAAWQVDVATGDGGWAPSPHGKPDRNGAPPRCTERHGFYSYRLARPNGDLMAGAPLHAAVKPWSRGARGSE